MRLVSGGAQVSGDPRLIADPAAQTLAHTPMPYVSALRYHDRMEGIPVHDEQGTRQRPYDLIVDFSPAAIDRALQDLGRVPWDADRPRVGVLLRITMGERSYWLTETGRQGIDQRESLQAASWLVGLPIHLPPQPKQAPTPPPGSPTLSGTLTWDARALSWGAQWCLADRHGKRCWQIAQVNFDSAFRQALRVSASILSGHGEPLLK